MSIPNVAGWLVAALAAVAAAAQTPAEDLLSASIAHHDPQGLWGEVALRFEISESRPDGTARETEVVLDFPRARFEYSTERQGRRIEAVIVEDECAVELDGSAQVSAEEVEVLGLGCDRMLRVRDYYSYLWGLPMKLRDPGTRLDPQVTRGSFDGRSAQSIRVTYDQEVGSDTWYFYFDPQNHALIGYRFYHDEQANDGEYIVLEDSLSGAGLRLPRRRTWFTHAADELLGTDTLMSIERSD